jgi:hypothetical protein
MIPRKRTHLAIGALIALQVLFGFMDAFAGPCDDPLLQTQKPSEIAAGVGIRMVQKVVSVQSLLKLMQRGVIAPRSFEINVTASPREMYQHSRVYLSLVGQNQMGQAVTYDGRGILGDNSETTAAILVFSLSVLDRNDYHISRGWLYGHYEQDFRQTEKAQSAEVVFFTAGETPSDISKPNLRGYKSLLRDFQQDGLNKLNQAFGYSYAATLKNFMLRMKQGGIKESAVKKVIAQLQKENSRVDWNKFAADFVAAANTVLSLEQAKFNALMRTLSGTNPNEPLAVIENNEVVMRAPLKLNTLQEIWVEASKLEEVITSLRSLGKPEQVNHSWSGRDWSDIVVARKKY